MVGYDGCGPDGRDLVGEAPAAHEHRRGHRPAGCKQARSGRLSEQSSYFTACPANGRCPAPPRGEPGRPKITLQKVNFWLESRLLFRPSNHRRHVERSEHRCHCAPARRVHVRRDGDGVPARAGAHDPARPAPRTEPVLPVLHHVQHQRRPCPRPAGRHPVAARALRRARAGVRGPALRAPRGRARDGRVPRGERVHVAGHVHLYDRRVAPSGRRAAARHLDRPDGRRRADLHPEPPAHRDRHRAWCEPHVHRTGLVRASGNDAPPRVDDDADPVRQCIRRRRRDPPRPPVARAVPHAASADEPVDARPADGLLQPAPPERRPARRRSPARAATAWTCR